MSERQKSPYDSIARRWLALVERREQHFIDLSRSGRWRHYYTQTEFLADIRKVLRVRNQWAVLAGLPVKNIPGDDDDTCKVAPTPAPVPAPAPDTRRRRPSLVPVSTKPAIV
jgi:uncharacterized repeat protein (TIGR03809 family)